MLLSDTPTVGGYGCIAQLIDADLPLAGQICPGDKVWFAAIAPEEARAILTQRLARYSAWLPGFSFG